MPTRQSLSLFAAVLFTAGCNTHPTAQPQAAKDAAPASGAVIVRVVGRHQTITATAGPAGPLYTATSADGTTIVANATLDELRDLHPDVYQQLVPATAGTGAEQPVMLMSVAE